MPESESLLKDIWEMIESKKQWITKEESQLSLKNRKGFLELPIEKRRAVLEQMAEKMVEHYQQNPEWKEA
jgi:hypothetical protein